jgi:hypothetical protein
MYVNDHIFLKTKDITTWRRISLPEGYFFANQYRSAVRDIYTRWMQIIDLSYTAYPFDREIYGDLATLRTALLFPRGSSGTTVSGSDRGLNNRIPSGSPQEQD